MKVDDLKQGVETLWGKLEQGFGHLRQSAAGALTRFRPGLQTQMPPAADIDVPGVLTAPGWGLVGGDVFEDEGRVVVRLELPGMDRQDFELLFEGDALLVRGEKRFERESTEGRWRVLQCAYGMFHRSVPLPAAVDSDGARATYRNGVLRVELPKREPSRPRAVQIRVG